MANKNEKLRTAMWYTPVQVAAFRAGVSAKLENNPAVIQIPEGLPDPMTYFNNRKQTKTSSPCDIWLNPINTWNQHVHRCDRQLLRDIHENIFNEEKNKIIPVLTSLNYGRPRLLSYDQSTLYNHATSTNEFYNATGTAQGTTYKDRDCHPRVRRIVPL